MPRSMADPQYRHQPWSEERKQAASAREKARIAAARASVVISGQDFAAHMEQMLAEYHQLEEQMEEAACALRYMKRQFPDQADKMEAAYLRLAKVIGWE